MSSSKSAASSAKSYDYYGSIFIGLGEGPIDAIVRILEDGKEIWAGPLLRDGATTPGLITIPERGKLRVRWGVTGQAPDPTLQAYGDDDTYDGRAGLVGDDFLFGQERTSSPNWEVVVRRAPKQSIVTGAAAALDDDAQANIVAFLAELATSATGIALPAAKLHEDSWQAVADQLDSPDMRSLFGCSPLLTSQAPLRDIIQQLGEIAQVWARRRSDGTIELGRWTPPDDVGALPLITAHDLTEEIEYETSDMDALPTDYTISFTDSSRLFKSSSERVPDLASARVSIEPKSENLTHPEITRRDQARRLVAEWIRQRRGGALQGTAQVRRSKALGIRPGDYFRLDIDPIPGGAGLAQLVRCLGRSYGPVGPIALEWQSEPASAPVPFVNIAGDAVPEVSIAVAPIFSERIISLPPAVGDPIMISVLAARPDDSVIGQQVLYDSDLAAGTFPMIGHVRGFALPVMLPQAIAAGDSTVRVQTFEEFLPGVRADRERWILETGSGAGETEARDDTMLLVLLRKNATTGALLDNGDQHRLEVCSLRSISLVATDTWDLGVLRGRLGTAALDFDASAGASFPDAFVHYEGWIVSRANLSYLTHADFAGLMSGGEAGYFRARAYTRRAIYDPVVAHDAGLQTTDDWTTWAFRWPSGYALPPAAVQFQYSSDGTSWHTDYTTGDIYFRQRYGSETWSAPILFQGPTGTPGADGTNSAVVYIYKRSASAPALPSATTTYNFITSMLTGLNNGWSTTVPAADGNPLYVAAATASNGGNTDTIAAGEWASPVILAQDGAAGADGLNAATIFLFQRTSSSTPPALPSASVTYTFATGAAAGVNNGWAQSMPTSGGSYRWMTTATALSAGATDTISAGEWATASLIAQDGAAGADGTHNAVVYIYRRASSTPSLPSATCTYTFATAALTGLNNGWSTTVPAADGNPLYVSAATASAPGASDTIASAEWATAVVMAQDGAPGTPGLPGDPGSPGNNGTDGINSATVFLFQRTSSNTPPSLPSASVTYTFATGAAAGVNNGWAQSMPTSGGSYRWMTTATALSTGSTDTIASGEWASASLIAQDGADGSPGTPGADGANGGSILGAVNSSSSVSISGTTATSIQVTANTPSAIVVCFIGTLANNTGSSSTFGVLVYIDGSATSPSIGYNTPSLSNGQTSAQFSIVAPVVGLSAGTHTIKMYVTGFPGSVTLSGALSVQ